MIRESAFSRRAFYATLVIACVCSWADASAQTSTPDPLPSWNDTAPKRSVIEFVHRITREDGPDYVRPAERIAVFDNDGTLWTEQPIYFQFAFALDRVKALAAQHPEWKDTQPYKAVIENDAKALAAAGEKGLLEIMAVTHTGVTTEEFRTIVEDWLEKARHPRFNKPYEKLTYQPMLELLDYLRANKFKTFIVSGGGVEFMRVFAERTYGIPPEQVVGSSGMVTFKLGDDGKPILVKEPKVEFIDDGPGKPVGINRFIGRRPIAAFGNSDGDLQMLQWTCEAPGPRFCLYVHHTDADREWAYDRKSPIGRLDKGLDAAATAGWAIVDMKADWNRIYADTP